MIEDIFLSANRRGVVYGLFATDMPLQIRYVGQTTGAPEMRLRGHHSPYAPSLVREWVRDVQARGHTVGMRVLGEYAVADLTMAEQKWMAFWHPYCGLLNSPRTFAGKRKPNPDSAPESELTLTAEENACTLALTQELRTHPGPVL